MSKVSRYHVDSLLDRGANDGVTGNDFRVVPKYPDRTVDICIIDNHEIAAIPLITAGGVTSTTEGKVILIMNQHVYHGKNKTIYSSPQTEFYKISYMIDQSR